MAKASKNKGTGKDEASNFETPAQQALSFLKKNKEDHYNFEESYDYKVPSSSMIMNTYTGGGLSPGAHRLVGVTGGGKTSCGLDYMKNFLSSDMAHGDHLAVYVKTEGRLPTDIRKRSGVNFVYDPEEWVAGTCFVLESNVYEAVFSFIGELIRNNPNKAKYMFIIDSVDMMAKRDDLKKPLEESGQVAGGALITSVFLKKTSVYLAKRGHFIFFVSQVRDEIKLNPYAGGGSTPRQGKSSGGHALEHAGDFVLEFLPQYTDDYFLEGGKGSKPIGHMCKIKILKANNETKNQIIAYPIKYGRTNGNSVWVEKEVADMLLNYNLVTRSTWTKIDEKLVTELRDAGFECEEKYHGWELFNQWLESNPEIIKYFVKKFNSFAT